MIIDFHTHIFPGKIAASTVHHLACEARIHPFTDGSADALAASMAASSVDWSVNLPVMTSGSQVEKVNASLLKKRNLFQEQHILSFGGLHPDCRNYRQVLRWLREEGVAGIKLHPAYMGIDLNDLRMMKLIEAISEEGLITIIHAGIDIGIYDHNYASVDHVLQIMKVVAPERFVLAHMGNWGCWDQVESDLAGAPLWMDTSFSLGPVTPYERIKDENKFRVEKANVLISYTNERNVITFNVSQSIMPTGTINVTLGDVNKILTLSDGIASYNFGLDIAVGGTYALNVIYGGDKYHNRTTLEDTFEITKSSTVLITGVPEEITTKMGSAYNPQFNFNITCGGEILTTGSLSFDFAD